MFVFNYAVGGCVASAALRGDWVVPANPRCHPRLPREI